MRTMGWGVLVLALAAGCPRSNPSHPEVAATEGDAAAEEASGSPTPTPTPTGETGTTSPGCVEPTNENSIGSATMEADGTIVLMLRAEGEGGLIGDAMFSYPPGDPHYQETLDHLCGLEPGQSKPVPPWPED